MRNTSILAVATTALTLAASLHAQGNIVEVAKGAGKFNTLLTAATKAGLVDTLTSKGPFTVFAPTDEAFEKVPAETLNALLANPEKLKSVLLYHVVPGKMPAAKVTKESWLESAQGQSLKVTVADGSVMIDGATVAAADVMASNGVIHVIDSVILPRPNLVETAVEAGSFSTLVKAVQEAGLVETLAEKGPFTIFAPSDAAFAKIPEADLKAVLADKKKLTEILTYHVVPGRKLASDVVGEHWLTTASGSALKVDAGKGVAMVDGAKIVSTDVIAGNGVIHVIDSVVMPRPSIVETAVAAGSFNTLVTAVKKAGLVDALEGDGPFTVFAPTDEAFAKLPEGTVEALLKEPAKLAKILKYHVVSGRVLSTDLKPGKAMVDSLARQQLTIQAGETGVMVDGANVVKADILARNGVIHVIDTVVLPSDK